MHKTAKRLIDIERQAQRLSWSRLAAIVACKLAIAGSRLFEELRNDWKNA